MVHVGNTQKAIRKHFEGYYLTLTCLSSEGSSLANRGWRVLSERAVEVAAKESIEMLNVWRTVDTSSVTVL